MLTGWDTTNPAARAWRAQRIATTCARVFLSTKAQQALSFPLGRHGEDRRSRAHRQAAESLHQAAIELGGLMLKAGQYLGARADRIPDEYVAVLSSLQDRVPPRPFSLIARQLERELGQPIEEVFAEVKRVPAAAASLAQVHEARLLDGTRVAVKLQYPEVRALVRDDLANLRLILRVLGIFDRQLDLEPLVEELAEIVPGELDFALEARNARRLGSLLAGRSDVAVPSVYDALSTERLLVMEWMDGIRITDPSALRSAGVSTRQVLEGVARVFAEQFFVHGFFHADPHPGNLLVQPEGPRLVLLDFGLMKELPADFRRALSDLVRAMLGGTEDGIREALLALGIEVRGAGHSGLTALVERFAAAGRALRSAGPDGPAELESLRRDTVALLRRHRLVRIPPHLVLVARALGLLSGLARRLETGVDLYAILAAELFRGNGGAN